MSKQKHTFVRSNGSSRFKALFSQISAKSSKIIKKFMTSSICNDYTLIIRKLSIAKVQFSQPIQWEDHFKIEKSLKSKKSFPTFSFINI